MHKNLKLVYTENTLVGIRDDSGFLLFFPKITRYPGQQERYEREIREQRELAQDILQVLQNRSTEVQILVTPANLSKTLFNAVVVKIQDLRCLYVTDAGEKEAVLTTAKTWANKFGYLLVEDGEELSREELVETLSGVD